MTYLSHNASFHSRENITPSNLDTKHQQEDRRGISRSPLAYDTSFPSAINYIFEGGGLDTATEWNSPLVGNQKMINWSRITL
ncbi:hypothetical protein [Acetobacter thailandicus]|uniref:hypothetical protein n=1 Tax=Acetobacter thailandicus TaxID=1502842 RepID=UPI001BA50412|nr:hypothetical protein [Acetobacter thailandicus]MBS1004532.1 hypothetical protein [Acetobacter thailandicus]